MVIKYKTIIMMTFFNMLVYFFTGINEVLFWILSPIIFLLTMLVSTLIVGFLNKDLKINGKDIF